MKLNDSTHDIFTFDKVISFVEAPHNISYGKYRHQNYVINVTYASGVRGFATVVSSKSTGSFELCMNFLHPPTYVIDLHHKSFQSDDKERFISMLDMAVGPITKEYFLKAIDVIEQVASQCQGTQDEIVSDGT